MRLLIAFLFFSVPANAQLSIVGKWKTIDDNSGKIRSVVEIFEKEGAFYGKIIQLYLEKEENQNPVCDKCDEDDDRYKKKVLGLEIIREMKKHGNELSYGHILDPENGSVYRCKIWIEDNKLRVRGYLGPFYRTQTWLPLQ